MTQPRQTAMKSSLAARLLLRLRQCAHPRRLMITPYWLVGLQLPKRASREESKGSSVFSGTFKSTRVSWQMKSSGATTEKGSLLKKDGQKHRKKERNKERKQERKNQRKKEKKIKKQINKQTNKASKKRKHKETKKSKNRFLRLGRYLEPFLLPASIRLEWIGCCDWLIKGVRSSDLSI